MAMIKYILFFIIFFVVVNVFVVFYITGTNIFSPLVSFYNSLVGRYAFLKDPLVTMSMAALVILIFVAFALIKVSGKV